MSAGRFSANGEPIHGANISEPVLLEPKSSLWELISPERIRHATPPEAIAYYRCFEPSRFDDKFKLTIIQICATKTNITKSFEILNCQFPGEDYFPVFQNLVCIDEICKKLYVFFGSKLLELDEEVLCLKLKIYDFVYMDADHGFRRILLQKDTDDSVWNLVFESPSKIYLFDPILFPGHDSMFFSLGIWTNEIYCSEALGSVEIDLSEKIAKLDVHSNTYHGGKMPIKRALKGNKMFTYYQPLICRRSSTSKEDRISSIGQTICDSEGKLWPMGDIEQDIFAFAKSLLTPSLAKDAIEVYYRGNLTYGDLAKYIACETTFMARLFKYFVFGIPTGVLAFKWPEEWDSYINGIIFEDHVFVLDTELVGGDTQSTASVTIHGEILIVGLRSNLQKVSYIRLNPLLKDYRKCGNCGTVEEKKRRNSDKRRIADFKVCRICKSEDHHKKWRDFPCHFCSDACFENAWKKHKILHEGGNSENANPIAKKAKQPKKKSKNKKKRK